MKKIVLSLTVVAAISGMSVAPSFAGGGGINKIVCPILPSFPLCPK